MRFSHLLFDLDGTLIDTTELILSCYRVLSRRLEREAPADVEILKGFGTPLPRQIRRLFPDLVDRADDLVCRWKEHQEELHDSLIKPFPEAVEVLAELRRRGYPLGVVTSKERQAAERDMALYGLHSLVGTVVCWDDTDNHKPHPEPVLRGMQLMGARPGATLYVGDSIHDMKAGREAGVRVAAALWGPFAREPLLDYRPDYLLESLRELLEICE